MSGSVVWRRVVAAVLVAGGISFLTITIARNARGLQAFRWDPEPLLLLVSVVALIAVFVWGVFVWSRVLAGFVAEPIAYRSLLRIWFLSSLARYIPGKVWQFLAAGQLARAAALPVRLLVTSMIVQMIFGLLAALIIAVTTLPVNITGIGPIPDGWLVPVVVVAAAFAHPRIINLGLGLAARMSSREVLVWRGRWTEGLALLVLSVVSWLFQGLAFFLFIDSLVSVPFDAVLPLTGINALSFATGYLVVLAPAGLGIREATMTVLLSPYVPDGVAAAIAVSSRLWTIAAELAGAFLVLTVVALLPVQPADHRIQLRPLLRDQLGQEPEAEQHETERLEQDD